jgi:hypothetical protein
MNPATDRPVYLKKSDIAKQNTLEERSLTDRREQTQIKKLKNGVVVKLKKTEVTPTTYDETTTGYDEKGSYGYVQQEIEGNDINYGVSYAFDGIILKLELEDSAVYGSGSENYRLYKNGKPYLRFDVAKKLISSGKIETLTLEQLRDMFSRLDEKYNQMVTENQGLQTTRVGEAVAGDFAFINDLNEQLFKIIDLYK